VSATPIPLVEVHDSVIALAVAAGKVTRDELAKVRADRHRTGRFLDFHVRGGLAAMSITELRECIALGLHVAEARRVIARRRARSRK